MPIRRVGEVQAMIDQVGGDVARRVERTPLEVVQQHVRLVRPFAIHIHQPGWVPECALSAQYHPDRVPGRIRRAARRQIVAILTAHLVPRKVLV